MSAAPKFTPGPWRVGGPNGFLNQLSIDPSIGAVYGAGAELEANAHLIAAAPDLYHALRNFLDACEREDRDALQGVIRAAYAALARVEGAAYQRDDAIRESDIIALLGGSHYMDPPDGGDVSLLEQLRRMAEDAAKWRKSEGSR